LPPDEPWEPGKERMHTPFGFHMWLEDADGDVCYDNVVEAMPHTLLDRFFECWGCA